MTMRSYRVTS